MRGQMPRSRGSMLVVVLFLAGLLGVFAAVAATVMRAAADVSRSFAEALRAEEAFRGSIERIVAQTGSSVTSAQGTAVFVEGQTQITITVRDEASRIDLNFASVDLLAGIFRQVGVAAEDAAVYAARVVDWRDEDDKPGPGGAERNAYRALGRVDGPHNAPFIHVAELSLVLGIPQRVAAAVAPYVTVAGGHEQINPLLADPPVLLALPGTSEQRVRDFMDQRKSSTVPFETLILRLGPVQDFVTEEKGSAARFEARVRLGANNERRFEAVVAVFEGDSEPFRIIAWDANPPERIRALP